MRTRNILIDALKAIKRSMKMEWLSVVSLVVGIFSIILAVYSMISTSKMQKRIITLCKTIRKLIDGREDEL